MVGEETRKASEPSKVGTGMKAEGGAAAPKHSAEQALQAEWACFSAFAGGVSGALPAAPGSLACAPCCMCMPEAASWCIVSPAPGARLSWR